MGTLLSNGFFWIIVLFVFGIVVLAIRSAMDSAYVNKYNKVLAIREQEIKDCIARDFGGSYYDYWQAYPNKPDWLTPLPVKSTAWDWLFGDIPCKPSYGPTTYTPYIGNDINGMTERQIQLATLRAQESLAKSQEEIARNLKRQGGANGSNRR